MRKILPLLCLILWAPVATFAQGERAVFDRVEHTLASSEPGQRFDYEEVSEGVSIYAWKSADDSLLILILTCPTAELARLDFESEPVVKRPHGSDDSRVPDEKVYGLGDENYMRVIEEGKQKMLVFRRGRYRVHIYSQTFDRAKKVAWDIVGLFPDA